MSNFFRTINASSTSGLAVKTSTGGTAVFIEVGGQTGIGGNVAPAQALDVTGHVKKSLGLFASQWTTAGNKTENEVFDQFSPYVPTTNDEIIVNGGFGNAQAGVVVMASSIKRTGAAEITIYGHNTANAVNTLVCADSDATNAINAGMLSW